MEQIRKIIPEPVRDLTPVVLIAAGGFYLICKAGSCVISSIQKQRMLNKWKDTPKDVVILHAFARGKTAPSASNFVIKLESYLRMANIPYQFDSIHPMSPDTKKSPWITLNGQHYSDSQLIIEMLAKKYDKRLGNYTDAERALGTVVRVMVDEHFYWGMILWRYVEDACNSLDKIVAISSFMLKIYRPMARKLISKAAWCQGTGRLSNADLLHVMGDDLRALSTLLGNKKFILGDEASEADCAIFGILAQLMWCLPGSPYEKMVKEEFPNLKNYTIRMKETYWPDWDKCLAKKSTP